MGGDGSIFFFVIEMKFGYYYQFFGKYCDLFIGVKGGFIDSDIVFVQEEFIGEDN